MNVLVMTSTYFPHVGGAETYARSLVSGLTERGHKVVVLTDGAWLDLPSRQKLDGAEVVRPKAYNDRLGSRDKVLWRLMQLAVFDDIAGLLEGSSFDLVHANSYETAIMASVIALDRRVPMVCSLHEQWPEREAFGPGRCELVYKRLPIELVLAASTYYVDKATSFGADPARVKLVYHGIAVEDFSDSLRGEGRRRLGIGDADYLVACAGRIYERKGLKDLVPAFARFRQKVPNARLVIAGAVSSFQYAAELRGLISELGVEDAVAIREDLVLDDMPSFFAAADLVVQPSLAEGLGLAVIEAMAAGRPIVATNVTGIAEVVTDGVDGLLVEARSPDQLAEAMLRVFREPELADSLAQGARRTAETRFRRGRMVDETLEAYADAIARYANR